MALRILGDPSKAEDAAQQTWSQLLRSWERVSVLTWEETEGYTVTVAKNAALDILWGWVRRRSRGKRPDWRLIAIVAALLFLSACAVVTGQFAQWFPRLDVDPAAPEVSEEVLDRMGTIIEQSQTADALAPERAFPS